MQLTRGRQIIVVAVCVLFLGCAGSPDGMPDTSDQSVEIEDNVDRDAGVIGRIRGSAVTLSASAFDGDLAIYEGDGWGWNPSLLVFLFLDDKTPPEGQSIVVAASEGQASSNPHVHFRWRDPLTEDIEVDSVMEDYSLTIEFGSVVDGYLLGHIEFSVPGEETGVSGSFQAVVKEQ
ncbi:MAG: hypothetical protein GY906_27300 [bacterium]|nr:hypothetical protein [bacterium]